LEFLTLFIIIIIKCGNADDGSLRLAKALGVYKEVKESYKKLKASIDEKRKEVNNNK